MTGYEHWTPDSGTHELPAALRGWDIGEMPTQELAWWHPRPSVPTLVTRPSHMARLRKVLGGIAVIVGCLVLSAVPSTPMDSPAVQVAP